MISLLVRVVLLFWYCSEAFAVFNKKDVLL